MTRCIVRFQFIIHDIVYYVTCANQVSRSIPFIWSGTHIERQPFSRTNEIYLLSISHAANPVPSPLQTSLTPPTWVVKKKDPKPQRNVLFKSSFSRACCICCLHDRQRSASVYNAVIYARALSLCLSPCVSSTHPIFGQVIKFRRIIKKRYGCS